MHAHYILSFCFRSVLCSAFSSVWKCLDKLLSRTIVSFDLAKIIVIRFQFSSHITIHVFVQMNAKFDVVVEILNLVSG